MLVQSAMDKADSKLKKEFNEKQERNKIYTAEFHKALANKAEFEIIAKNSVQPLEYKLN